MEVQSYTFKSPYPSAVQVGQADATSKQSEKSQEDPSIQAQKDAQLLEATQQTKTQPDAPERLLDIYA